MGQINTTPKEILNGLDVMMEIDAPRDQYEQLFRNATQYLLKNPSDLVFREQIIREAKKFGIPTEPYRTR